MTAPRTTRLQWTSDRLADGTVRWWVTVLVPGEDQADIAGSSVGDLSPSEARAFAAALESAAEAGDAAG